MRGSITLSGYVLSKTLCWAGQWHGSFDSRGKGGGAVSAVRLISKKQTMS